MKNSTDPSQHKERESQFIEHVRRLLDDERVRLDTTRGRRSVTTLIRNVDVSDRGVDLKRMMSEMDLPDRALQARMPVGQTLTATLSQKYLFFLKKTVARLRVVSVSPTRALLAGEAPEPMTGAAVQKILSELPLDSSGVPETVVVLSTGGFTLEAHELADRRRSRTLIMAEPNDAGGWNITGPAETKALADLFDPEQEQNKRQRVRKYIEDNRVDLMTSGLAGDRIADKTQLPLSVVEAELKAYTKENTGLVAKRLDGRFVLFRDSAAPAEGAGAGGLSMPFIDKVKSLFARRGEEEKKVAFLAERRAALSQQRDRLFEDMSSLEQKETQMREEFKSSSSALTKRRLTSQLLQFRKDIERRQQLLAVLGQQVNVVSTALHNLELVRQGQSAQLPDSEELTADAVRAEEMLAELEADNELAGSVSSIATAGMSDEEQALYEELEKEAGADKASETAAQPNATSTVPSAQSDRAKAAPAKTAQATPPARNEARRNEPEAG